MVDDRRKTTSKKSWEYSKFELFEHLLFLEVGGGGGVCCLFFFQVLDYPFFRVSGPGLFVPLLSLLFFFLII